MQRREFLLAAVAASLAGTRFAAGQATHSETPMQLGAFSVSLAVKDLSASRAFYEKLGFTEVGGQADQGWLILRNGAATIGLFQGLFEKNILTFNPGWDSEGSPVAEFEDVREIQKRLQDAGLTPEVLADANTEGPAFITLTDPDGNPILIDQHV